jgi:N-acetylglutamate synthase-like GNAT family acetyltransferase
MDFSIRPATLSDVPVISSLLHKIWRPTYGIILSEKQTQFMLSTLFSAATMKRQMLEENHHFVLAFLASRPFGFAAYQNDFKEKCCKVHKLYLLPGEQGKGRGRILLEELIRLAEEAGQKSILLNVNRANSAKSFYEKLGFAVMEEVDIPIGNGYFMNDYVMERKL